MSNFIDKFSLKHWWNIVGLLGLIFCFGGGMYDFTFLEEKNLFGLGLGLLIIGLAYMIACKETSTFKPANAYTGGACIITYNLIQHNLLTWILLIIGTILTIIFFIKILLQLL